MASIHAKCGAVGTDRYGRTLFCHKSKGHASPECYDAAADARFVPEYKPRDGKKR